MGRISVDKERLKTPKKREDFARLLFPVFMEQGIKNLSTNDICNTLSKSKATVYKHFDSKKDIITYILNEKLEAMKKFPRLLFSKDEYKVRYQKAVKYISDILEDVSPLFLSELKEIYPDLWRNIENFKQSAISILKTFYNEGIESEVVIKIDPEYLILQDELFFDTLINPFLMKSRKLDIKKAFNAYFEIRFNGIMKR